MHILFLTDNFPPESNAPANRTYEHAKAWVKQGHKVTIVTCAPNFPYGRVFKGYRNRLYQTEEMDGISVIRVWSFMTRNKGFLLRMIDFLSFMVSGFLGGLRVRGADLVIGTSPQFFTTCAACLLAWVKRKPFIFEMRDIWPDSLSAVGMKRASVFVRLVKPLANFIYRRADHIVVVTNSFRTFLQDHGIPKEKISVIFNGIDQEKFTAVEADQALVKKLGLKTKFIVGYIGTHGMAHHLETFVEAANLAAQSDQFSNLHFLTVGTGAEYEKIQTLSAGLKNMTMIGQVERDAIPRYWSILDVAVIHLRNDALFETVIPSKMFEAMSMSIPILHGVKGESADLVQSHGVGLLFTPEQPNELLDKLQTLMNDSSLRAELRSNALQAAKSFDRADQAEKMILCLQETLSRHG